MTTNLIKLLVNIEETAKSSKRLAPLASSQKRLFNFSKLAPLSAKFPNRSKEKQQRRALRSKISKILQNLPHRCEKDEQKEFSVKWYNQKKKFYEMNKQRKLKGQDPITKLNLSSESECAEGAISAREALLENLNEDELVLLSEDPHYFISDKKLFKTNVENNWDELLKKDYKEQELKKPQKKNTLIDFLKEPKEKQAKTEKPVKSKLFHLKTPGSIFSRSPEVTKPSTKHIPLRRNFKQMIQTKVNSVPILEKQPKRPEHRQEHVKRSEALSNDSIKFESFLKASDEYQNSLKSLIAKSATEAKLIKVKSMLCKWELKKKVSF